jgi:hypothetical protein
MVVEYKDKKYLYNSTNYTPRGLEKMYPEIIPEWRTNTYIDVVDEKYITLGRLEPGLTIIKSPKGSGKTTFLKRVLSPMIHRFPTMELYEESTFGADRGDVKIYGDEKILLVGHRQSLLGDCRIILNSEYAGYRNYLLTYL